MKEGRKGNRGRKEGIRERKRGNRKDGRKDIKGGTKEGKEKRRKEGRYRPPFERSRSPTTWSLQSMKECRFFPNAVGMRAAGIREVDNPALEVREEERKNAKEERKAGRW